jgi:S1-C subfamily serine protease
LKANDDDDKKENTETVQENTAELPSKRYEHNFINAAVELATPAIVEILFKNIVPDEPNSTSKLPTTPTGSGFIVSADGLIITSALIALHYNGDPVVRLADGRELPARVLKVDHKSDIALLKIESVCIFYFQNK